jgi:hypothetical protein
VSSSLSFASGPRKLRAVLYVFLCGLLAFGAYRYGRTVAADEMLYAQCLRVTPAMTEVEVIAIMGSPDSVRESAGERRLSYERYRWYSSGPVDIVLAQAENGDSEPSTEGYGVARTVCEDIW